MQVARLAISSRALLSRHAAASLPSISVLGEWWRLYICMDVYTYACMHSLICVIVWRWVCIYERVYVCMCVYLYVCLHVCTFACVYVCMCVRLHVCSCVFVFMYVRLCVAPFYFFSRGSWLLKTICKYVFMEYICKWYIHVYINVYLCIFTCTRTYTWIFNTPLHVSRRLIFSHTFCAAVSSMSCVLPNLCLLGFICVCEWNEGFFAYLS